MNNFCPIRLQDALIQNLWIVLLWRFSCVNIIISEHPCDRLNFKRIRFNGPMLKKIIRLGVPAMLLGTVITLFMSLLAVLFREPLVRLYTTEAAVLPFGIMTILVSGIGYVTYVPCDILGGVMRGSGNTIMPMIITLISICVLRIVWLLIAIPIWHEYIVVVLCYLPSMKWNPAFGGGNWYGFWGLVVSAICMVVISLITRQDPKDSEEFYAKLESGMDRFYDRKKVKY